VVNVLNVVNKGMLWALGVWEQKIRW